MTRYLVVGMQAAGLLMAQTVSADSVGDVFHRVNASVAIVRADWTEITGPGEPTKVSEVGSGFLISRDGRMITAAHLVQTADEVVVEFLSGEQAPAKVIASEPAADLALLQVERVPEQALVASLGDSAKARTGDDVFIIGAPYGIGHTLSVGHISARFRPGAVYSEMALAEFLQTDAAINPGNSGGPMFNMAGEVIGVASHNISKSGGFEGLGFVVTINMAKRLLLEERSHWSGLSGVIVTGVLAKALNLPEPAGILVQQVAANSPASRIGLRPGTIQATIGGRTLLLGGDVILAVLGVPVGDETYEERRERVRQLPPGAPLTLTVLRDGRQITLSRISD
jgi:serine protease Do